MSMQTLTRDVDAAAVAGNSDAYGLTLATQARQKPWNIWPKNCQGPNSGFCLKTGIPALRTPFMEKINSNDRNWN